MKNFMLKIVENNFSTNNKELILILLLKREGFIITTNFPLNALSSDKNVMIL